MKKNRILKTIFLTMCMLLCISLLPNKTKEVYVYAYDYDLDDDWEDFDDGFGEEEPDYDYSDINEEFDMIEISNSSKKYTYPESELNDGETNVHYIKVKKSANYIIGLSEYATYGAGSILIRDDSETEYYQEYFDVLNEEFKDTVYLEKGEYSILIQAEDWLGLEYELYIKPETRVVKETKKVKIYSCETQKLNPKLGKGKWTTSNKNIISLKSKNTTNHNNSK